jgi:hypothetical protein
MRSVTAQSFISLLGVLRRWIAEDASKGLGFTQVHQSLIRHLLYAVRIGRYGPVAECHERLLTEFELDSRKAACREQLLWVLTSRPTEKLPDAQAIDSLRPVADIEFAELSSPNRT